MAVAIGCRVNVLPQSRLAVLRKHSLLTRPRSISQTDVTGPNSRAAAPKRSGAAEPRFAKRFKRLVFPQARFSCCNCVPGSLPQLPNRRRNPLTRSAFGFAFLRMVRSPSAFNTYAGPSAIRLVRGQAYLFGPAVSQAQRSASCARSRSVNIIGSSNLVTSAARISRGRRGWKSGSGTRIRWRRWPWNPVVADPCRCCQLLPILSRRLLD